MKKTDSAERVMAERRENMKSRKYGYALLMICLIVLTVLLSVKSEQKKLSEETALQEQAEELSEEAALQEEEPSEELTENIESEATSRQEESESEKEEILYEHTLEGHMWFYYEEEEVPFVDEETFALILEAYDEVEYSAEFETGNEEVYEAFKQKFWRLMNNEVPFLDRETGKEVYIRDYYEAHGWYIVRDFKSYYSYYYFDMNRDGLPELCVDGCVFTYDPDMDQCSLWTWLNGKQIVGTRKAIWNPEYNIDIYEFFQLDSEGRFELDTLFWAEYAGLPGGGSYDINMVMFPNYADREKRWEITEEMKRQGVFEESSGQWFFRITDEQFEELEKPYRAALEQAGDRMREVRYTYEELFGEYGA
ncbi:MAG: hypothetical protein NC415_11695 [bacterium]|nr:hypothetical protein [bacterium]